MSKEKWNIFLRKKLRIIAFPKLVKENDTKEKTKKLKFVSPKLTECLKNIFLFKSGTLVI